MDKQVDFINTLVEYFKEEAILKDTIKGVKDKAKEAGFDASAIATVAKAIANANEAELVEKSQALIDTVQVWAG